MKNYKFSLESVLEVRSNEEQNVLEDFVVAQNALTEEEDKKKRLDNELKRCLRKRSFIKNVQTLVMDNLYKNDLEAKINLQGAVVEEKKVELEKVRERLVIAQKDRKVMEKLKEKDLEEYTAEIMKENQKELDDFAILGFKRA